MSSVYIPNTKSEKFQNLKFYKLHFNCVQLRLEPPEPYLDSYLDHTQTLPDLTWTLSGTQVEVEANIVYQSIHLNVFIVVFDALCLTQVTYQCSQRSCREKRLSREEIFQTKNNKNVCIVNIGSIFSFLTFKIILESE